MYKSGFLRLRPALSAAVFLLGSANAHAQFDAGSVEGYLRDASGAAVARGELALTNVDTGVVRKLTADAEGRYQFVSVPVGRYTVSGSAAGLQSTATSPFQLTVNATQRVDLKMAVGTLALRCSRGGRPATSIRSRSRTALASPATTRCR